MQNNINHMHGRSCPQGKKRCNTSFSPLYLQLGILCPLLCFGYKNGRRSCDVLHKQCGIFRHTHHFWREFGRVLLLYSWLIGASFIALLGTFLKFITFRCSVKDALFVCSDTCNQFWGGCGSRSRLESFTSMALVSVVSIWYQWQWMSAQHPQLLFVNACMWVPTWEAVGACNCDAMRFRTSSGSAVQQDLL